MARFKSDIRGSRGPASRLGSCKSGMVAHTRGWNTGVEVVAEVDEDGHDRFVLYLTRGSNRPWERVPLCRITEKDPNEEGVHGASIEMSESFAINPVEMLQQIAADHGVGIGSLMDLRDSIADVIGEPRKYDGRYGEGQMAPTGAPSDVADLLSKGGL